VTDTTTEQQDVEETYQVDEQGVAYTSESAASAEASLSEV
jgi:hypothetical protein